MQPRYCSSHAATARSATVVLTVPAPAPSALAILPLCAVDEIIDIVDGPKMITLEQVGGQGAGAGTPMQASGYVAAVAPYLAGLVWTFDHDCAAPHARKLGPQAAPPSHRLT